MIESEHDRATRELAEAWNEFSLALEEALYLPRIVMWIDRQLRRWPALYRLLSR